MSSLVNMNLEVNTTTNTNNTMYMDTVQEEDVADNELDRESRSD